ncbi:hypothetical protein VTN02DRAFT_268 [Thermoascus thermophilus]
MGVTRRCASSSTGATTAHGKWFWQVGSLEAGRTRASVTCWMRRGGEGRRGGGDGREGGREVQPTVLGSQDEGIGLANSLITPVDRSSRLANGHGRGREKMEEREIWQGRGWRGWREERGRGVASWDEAVFLWRFSPLQLHPFVSGPAIAMRPPRPSAYYRDRPARQTLPRARHGHCYITRDDPHTLARISLCICSPHVFLSDQWHRYVCMGLMILS